MPCVKNPVRSFSKQKQAAPQCKNLVADLLHPKWAMSAITIALATPPEKSELPDGIPTRLTIRTADLLSKIG